MSSFADLVRFRATAGGTTDWVVSSAIGGCQTPALANVLNGVSYKIYAVSDDLTQFEVSTGLYNSGTTTFPRTTVLYNSSGTGTAAGQSGAGTKINFSLAPQVAVVALAEDLPSLNTANTFTVTSANALTVGPNGTTNPGFNIDTSTASSATGWNIKSAAAAGGAALSVISSGTNENATIDAKGTGTITLGGTSTGAVISTRQFQPNAGMLISSTPAAAPLDATFNGSTLNGVITRSTTTAASTHHLFTNPSVVGSIVTTGSATAYNTSSDERLKTNFAPLTNAGDIIDRLNVGTFKWKIDGADGYGVLAQHAHTVFPSAVSVGDDDLTEDDARPWSVDYSKFVPLLLAEMKALRARVAELEARTV